MKRVFADSSYWIGLREKEDRFHVRSKKIAAWLVQNRYTLVVTPFIFAESHAYFSRVREIRELIIRDFWANPLVEFEQPTYLDQTKAVEILKQHRDKSYSFVDAVSFTLMSRMQLSEVVTFDGHFRQFGHFQVIDGSNI
jgi:uncharacterized protein